MKKALFSLLALLMMGNAYAADTFTVDNVTLPQNGEADVTVRFSLDQNHTCSGYTFWLQVPNGLTFVTTTVGTETVVNYTQGDSYGTNAPTITPNISEGYLKVACMTASSTPLNKQTGVLVTFRIKAVGTPAVNTVYNCTLSHATISAESGSVSNVADAAFTVTIAAPLSQVVLDETSTTAPAASNGAVNVKVNRTIAAGNWSTICLPFDMTADQVTTAFGNDVVLKKLSSWSFTGDNPAAAESITLGFTTATTIEKNVPCLIKVSSAISSFDVDNVVIAPVAEPCSEGVGYKVGKKTYDAALYGTYIKKATDVKDMFLADNKFWYSTGQTEIKAFRATFYFDDVVLADYNGGSSARVFMTFDDDNTTGISHIERQAESDAIYNLNGQRMTNPAKGLYIKNGKKVIIK